ncbi:MAG: ABC transporter permease subunit [Azospirillum sp.]|nr:ABC transporter permease subunit [Azospirillum sp.]
MAWPRIGSLGLALVAWQIAAWAAAGRVLPGPLAVASGLAEAVASGALPFHLAVTLCRVAAGFVLAMALGSVLGLAMGLSPGFDRWADGWLVILLNLPALVVIILCYVWFGLTEVAAVTAVALVKLPNVAVVVREGARALDRDYAELAVVCRFSRWQNFRHVVLPQLAPYLLAAARNGLSLIWKIVLVAELLGRSNGVGFQFGVFFQLFDVRGLLVYSTAFVACVLVVEFVVLQPLEQRLNRWRR